MMFKRKYPKGKLIFESEEERTALVIFDDDY